MRHQSAPTIRIDIFIAGDPDQAKQACREYCFETGFCVSVEPVSFIYTGGEELGVRVRLINYPRFPMTTTMLLEKAEQLGRALIERLCQHSFSIVGPDETTWYSRRPE
jgi:hypothetical protein